MRYIRGAKMKTYTVDFTGVRSYWAFYEALIKGLELPDWCGHNAAAIWDMLTAYIDYPATIYLRGTNMLPEDLNGVMNIIKEIFQKLLEEYDCEKFAIKYVN